MSQQNNNYQVKVNNFSFELTAEALQQADIIQVQPHMYHVLEQHRSVTVTIISSTDKHVTVAIGEERFEVAIKDGFDQMLDQLGFSKVSVKQVKDVKAPMPGLVLSIAVTEGQAVKENERILILEAMKMENSILMPNDAVIKRIAVKPGQAVEKGQVLIELA